MKRFHPLRYIRRGKTQYPDELIGKKNRPVIQSGNEILDIILNSTSKPPTDYPPSPDKDHDLQGV